MEKGDIIIDGGNSHYPDSIRRTQELGDKGLLFVGAGVSGGEEGARYVSQKWGVIRSCADCYLHFQGPSIMPGTFTSSYAQQLADTPHLQEVTLRHGPPSRKFFVRAPFCAGSCCLLTTRLFSAHAEKTAAQVDGEPCCDWVGEGGAGK